MSYDRITGLLFFGLTFIFITVSMTNQPFFDWAFDRHHNQWSWYLRPFFLIPFCYFAYKRSLAGIAISIFCLFTSMCWFNKPDIVDSQVISFLAFEKEWLYGTWSYQKILSVLLIPISLFVLALAFWKRSLLSGLAVVVLMAIGKIFWSIQNAGESGKSIIIPAIVGLIVCSGLIFFGYRKLEQKKKRI